MHPGAGLAVRTDVVEVHVFRRGNGQESEGAELLLLRRAKQPLIGTWHPVLGHIESGETAVAAAMRELREEVGLTRADPGWLGLYALEQVHPFYIAALDQIVMTPRFAAEVGSAFTPRLNHEHDSHRWVRAEGAAREMMWPGQRAAVREIAEHLLAKESAARAWLRIDP